MVNEWKDWHCAPKFFCMIRVLLLLMLALLEQIHSWARLTLLKSWLSFSTAIWLHSSGAGKHSSLMPHTAFKLIRLDRLHFALPSMLVMTASLHSLHAWDAIRKPALSSVLSVHFIIKAALVLPLHHRGNNCHHRRAGPRPVPKHWTFGWQRARWFIAQASFSAWTVARLENGCKSRKRPYRHIGVSCRLLPMWHGVMGKLGLTIVPLLAFVKAILSYSYLSSELVRASALI